MWGEEQGASHDGTALWPRKIKGLQGRIQGLLGIGGCVAGSRRGAGGWWGMVGFTHPTLAGVAGSSPAYTPDLTQPSLTTMDLSGVGFIAWCDSTVCWM